MQLLKLFLKCVLETICISNFIMQLETQHLCVKYNILRIKVTLILLVKLEKIMVSLFRVCKNLTIVYDQKINEL